MMDTTTSYCTTPHRLATAMSFWQSCFAVFARPPPSSPIAIIRPPPMTSHYYSNMLSPGRQYFATFLSPHTIVPKNIPTVRSHTSLPAAFASHTPSLFGVSSSKGNTECNAKAMKENHPSQKQPRIAIIGGGIAGVTAANALGKKFENDAQWNPKIVVFEADGEGGHRCVNFENCEQPTWIAGEYH